MCSRCDERVIRDGVSIVRMRDGSSGCVGVGSLAGRAPPLCRYAESDRRGARARAPWLRRRGRTTSIAAVAARARICAQASAGGNARANGTDCRGAHAPGRQLSGIRLSNRGVVTSGDGADRMGAPGVDGAKSRRRHQPMRNRRSEAGQQPYDGRCEFRHDFPDPLSDCVCLHRAARPCSRCCLHGSISKQRASARTAARTGAERVRRGGCATLRTRKCFRRETRVAGPVGGASGPVRNDGNDGGIAVPRDGDSAGETHAARADRFHPCNACGAGGGVSLPFRSRAGCVSRHVLVFDCPCSHAQNCATSGSSAGAPGAIHQ
ncbi:hypothetical protein GEM_0435 [Burkholderia cepacia GG4]|uniref:Uncharacterized protein n=1 Tax=Burkholderia cepacia GG4 TaxID=1009846 RepID=A0A9W3JWY0_BURCE|nr:hypothetical protein GEM_0435 [Burkholderia cepacia GG4]